MPPMQTIPLSLYIHLPWCAQKCPYCDFNSHQTPKELPEMAYISALLQDFEQDLPWAQGREIQSIFIGGGTPSLFSPTSLKHLLQGLHQLHPISPRAEITLEANPNSSEQAKFQAFRELGINRLSIGVQSFDEAALKSLGRVHDGQQARTAIQAAKTAGFESFNIDLMHGLPGQSLQTALEDLRIALEFSPPHLSWYQLTIEPETVFAKHPPHLPSEEILWEIDEQGRALLEKAGLERYEVSAYAREGRCCQHNLNYWQFGDYLGIGAGAHGKITELATHQITRYHKQRGPRDYLNPDLPFTKEAKLISPADLPLDFMINALRLPQGFPVDLLERTGLKATDFAESLAEGERRGWILRSDARIQPSPQGLQYLNDCLALF